MKMWITRDKGGGNKYRLFLKKPVKLLKHDWWGESIPNEYSWTIWTPDETDKRIGRTSPSAFGSPRNDNIVRDGEIPIRLKPGEGPVMIEAKLTRIME